MKKPQSEISMIPLAQSSAPVRNLVDYWNEARLHAASAKSSSVRPAPGIVPWRAALEDVLKVGYGVQAQPRFLAGAWQQVRWRTTPSAGALYPFEVIVSIVGEGTYLWEIERGHLVPYDARPLTREGLAAAGLATRPGHRVEALVSFVARPWLSMKKYLLRGYAYCHLDVGHTATNLALYTAALGHDSVLHLRFSRAFLAEHLRLEGLCREPLAVLSFTSVETGTELAAPVPDPDAGIPPIGLDLPGEQEIRSWEALQGILSYDLSLQPPGEPASAALLAAGPEVPRDALLPLPEGRPPFGPAAEWRSAILHRRSAKGFRPEPVGVEEIGELLAALRGTGLPSDCSLNSLGQIGLRVVARNVDGLSGIYAYAPWEHALQQIDPRADDPRPACMQQGLAGNAAALLIFHTPLCGLIERHGFSPFTELHFRAAELGQRLHLVATRLGLLGITCIGGFDGEECAALARLGADEETIYVILVGIRDESVFKHDQLNVAFSHGHTTTLED
ncbi:MAG TPA: nitroreductase family protein [Thermoanaerobaculia bacterium]|nr:nitroreductase family protein [Thermoanaerobaculia bacterium]